MSKELTYFAFDFTDYIRDTRTLDFVEHGIYWLLLVEYYSSQRPIPNDEERMCFLLLNGVNLGKYTEGAYRDPNGGLSGILSDPMISALNRVLKAFFFLDESDNCWHHKRCDEQISIAYQRAQMAVESGRIGAAKRWLKGAHKGPHKGAYRVPNGEPVATKTKTYKKNSSTKSKKKTAGFQAPDLAEVQQYVTEQKLTLDAGAFHDHFTSNGWKVGGKAPMKDWKAAARNWARRNANGGTRQTNADSHAGPVRPRHGDTKAWLALASRYKVQTYGKTDDQLWNDILRKAREEE